MRHRSFYIMQLTLGDRPLASRGGTLVIAERESSPELDWELVFQTREVTHIDKAAYRLTMEGPEGGFVGDGILVRSDATSHVFRGGGDLSGFDREMFPPPAS